METMLTSSQVQSGRACLLYSCGTRDVAAGMQSLMRYAPRYRDLAYQWCIHINGMLAKHRMGEKYMRR